MASVTRYHPLLVTLHWLLAFLLLGELLAGFLVLEAMPNTDPQKIQLLQFHMVGGTLICTLTLIRLITRLRSNRPAAATTGNPLLDRLALVNHYGLYALVFAMVAAGYTTAFAAGLPAIVFGGSGAPLPADFEMFPSAGVHGAIGALILLLVALHLLAALYHQFIRRDGLLSRMAFGRRTAA